MAKPKPTKMLAVLGRSRRTGRWRLASRSSVLSLLGSCYLDMTNSFVDDKEKLRMTVTVFLGSATFILPDGAEVRPSGTAVIAASMVDVPDHDDTSDLPTLNIEWTCIFGRIRILSEDAAAKLEAEQAQKRLEKAIKKGKAKPPVIEVSEAAPPRSQSAAPAAVKQVEAQVAPEPEPVVAGVGFDDLPADDEPAVTGVGFDDLPAEDEPAVTGVGFDDLPTDDEPEPVVTGVGFEDIPAEDEAEPAEEPAEPADDEPADEAPAADAEEPEGDVERRPSADVGFVDMEYDPDAVTAAV